MKKYLTPLLVLLALASSVFLSVPNAARASDVDGINGTPSITQTLTSTGANETLTGYLNSDGIDQYDSSHLSFGLGSLEIWYGKITDSSKVTLTSPINTASGVSNPSNVGCSVDDTKTSSTYKKFLCVVPVTSNATYVYKLGYDGSTDTTYSDNQQFVVTGITGGQTTPASTILVTFGSAAVSGNSATVTMNVSGVTVAAQGTMQLGTAVQQGSTSIYTCLPGSITSPAITISPNVNNQPSTVRFMFTNLPDNNYCVRPQAIVPPLTTPVSIGDPSATDANGYFTNAGALFSVGAATLANGATNNATANPTGCVTKSDNSNYCLLAPLPGVGDNTGSLDVTSFSSYFLIIIKIVMGLIGVLSVLMITIGGIEYMTTVSIGEKEGAKSRITSALFGLLLALSSYVILNTINPKLVSLGVTIPNVQVSTDPDTYTPTSGGGQYTGSSPTTNVTGNITTYDAMLKASSAKYGVECTLMKAFMYAESNGNPTASSGVGAKGLIQLMPATFTGLGYDISKITDPATNIDAASKYVSQLKSTACNGSSSNSVCNVNDNQYVIAAYNGGAKANGLSTVCQKGQGVNETAWQCTLNSGYQQTRNYVPKVIGNYQKLTAQGWGC